MTPALLGGGRELGCSLRRGLLAGVGGLRDLLGVELGSLLAENRPRVAELPDGAALDQTLIDVELVVLFLRHVFRRRPSEVGGVKKPVRVPDFLHGPRLPFGLRLGRDEHRVAVDGRAPPVVLLVVAAALVAAVVAGATRVVAVVLAHGSSWGWGGKTCLSALNRTGYNSRKVRKSQAYERVFFAYLRA